MLNFFFFWKVNFSDVVPSDTTQGRVWQSFLIIHLNIARSWSMMGKYEKWNEN